MVRLPAFALLAIVLPAQDFSDIKMDRVASGFRFTEGPAWSKDGFLVFSDIPNNKILKWTPGKGVEVLRNDSGGANGNAIDDRGRIYTCEGAKRRVVRSGPKGQTEVLAEKFEGKRLNSPNDIVVRRDGNAWFTDPAFGSAEDSRELSFYGVFHLSPKGELSAAARWPKRPNGVALSPNGRILYVAGSDERVIRAYDVDRQGSASNERVLITGIQGVPDGLKTDEKGNLWVACEGLAVYSPEGRRLHFMELAEKPAILAFGEADFQSLFVTARTVVFRVRAGVKGAHAPE
jgi:gluconolactonase